MPIDNFPFTEIRVGRCCPCLHVRIINPDTGANFLTSGLIDTGADECAIPALYAPILGHDLCAGTPKQINTGNGKTVAYSHTTKFEILHPKDAKTVLYTSENTPVDFLPNLSVTLLGVENFLGKFILNIDYPKNTFSIKHPK